MNQVIVAYTPCDRQLSDALISALLQRLPYARRLALRGDACGQTRTLLGIELARRLLTHLARRPVLASEFRFANTGRPWVAGLAHFSITHSSHWLGCALRARARVGLDLEEHSEFTPLSFTHAFDADERRAACDVSAALRVWTTKEAALKAHGLGLRSIRGVRVRGEQVHLSGERLYARSVPAPEGVVCSVVSDQPMSAVRVVHVSLETLLAARWAA